MTPSAGHRGAGAVVVAVALGVWRVAVPTATLAALLLLAGCAGTGSSEARTMGIPAARAAAAPVPGVGAANGFQDPDLGSRPSNSGRGLTPVHVSIPAIGVESDLETLALQADGRIQAPVDWQSAGWYKNGIVPGDPGPAVIAGHVDSPHGPAVFFNLSTLVPGDRVVVTMSDTSKKTYAVDRSLRASKAQFPTSEVYRSTPTPELRLITCAGAWDASTGHYVDNLVVFATLSRAP